MRSLDTNVLLYAADEDCPEHGAALRLLDHALPAIRDMLAAPTFPRGRTYDLVLATTLRANGVDTFYTRNLVDFQDAGFATLVNPID